jgi:DNA polymerase V
MILAGINDGDILIVDRSIQAKNGSIVIAVLNSELTVKRLKLEEGRCYLVPENDIYHAIEVTTDMDFIVWGVVTSVIHQF